MGRINKTTEETRYRMLRASAQALPDSPTQNGMNATQIKRALWAPMLGEENSVLSEQGRIVDEANAALEELDGEIGSDTLTTTAQTLVGAINENKSAIDVNKSNIAANEEAIGTLNSRLTEYETIVREHGENKKAIGNASELQTHSKTLVGAINENKDGIANRDKAISTLQDRLTGYETVVKEHGENKKAIGNASELQTRSKTLVGAINENKASISSFFKQVEGKSQSYVLNTFEEFIRLLAYDDGVGFYCDYLNTGDNLLIVEREVPDFWYEKIEEDNLSLDDERITSAPTYTYQGKEYSLAAVYDWEDGTYYLDGVFHILENDFSKVKELLHEKLLEKVDKIQNVSTNIYVYAESPSKGTILYGTSYNATKNTIPLRYNGGVLDVGTPTANDHAVNLGYLNGQITPMQKQITLLEKKVGFIETEFVTVEGANETITVPEGALPFAQILEIHGRAAVYEYEEFPGYPPTGACVANYPAQFVSDDGIVLLDIPDTVAGELSYFGLWEGNYICFKDGKAIYHQEHVLGGYSDPPQDESGNWLEGYTWVTGIFNDGGYGYGVWKLPTPVEKDISDIFDFDGILHAKDTKSIRVVMRYSDADIDAMNDSYEYTDEYGEHTFEHEWNVGHTKIVFEV